MKSSASRLYVLAVVGVITATSLLSVPGSAVEPQVLAAAPSDLESARSEILRIQSQARTVQDKIDAIDEEAAAVRSALRIAQTEVKRTQGEIRVIRTRLAEKERMHSLLQARASAMAVELYKGGPTAQIEALLDSQSLADLDSMSEYSRNLSQEMNRIMVATGRVKSELEAERRDLQDKLAEAKEARNEQRDQAQHLSDLRRAQSLRLGRLKKEIAGAQAEVAATAARSSQISADLGGTVALGASASGFAWPIQGAITSGFGPRWGGTHSGIDIDCVTGAAIRASKAGSVVSATYDSGYGYHVVIDHGGGFASLYAHASELYVSGGTSVSQGETIAACGSTGQSTGDHLHFEIRVNGTPQNPLNYLP